MMNLYITHADLRTSAQNLDDVRIKAQYFNLLYSMSRITEENEDLIEWLLRFEKDSKYTLRGKSYKRLFIGELKSKENHSVTKWLSKSPLHYIIGTDFLHCLQYEMVWRGVWLPTNTINTCGMLCYVGQGLKYFVPLPSNKNKLFGLENYLYRNLDEAFIDTTYSPKAYQLYLIECWKDDLKKLHDRKIAYGEWLKLNDSKAPNKPRSVKSLKWGGRRPPVWAFDELELYRKKLKED